MRLIFVTQSHDLDQFFAVEAYFTLRDGDVLVHSHRHQAFSRTRASLQD